MATYLQRSMSGSMIIARTRQKMTMMAFLEVQTNQMALFSAYLARLWSAAGLNLLARPRN